MYFPIFWELSKFKFWHVGIYHLSAVISAVFLFNHDPIQYGSEIMFSFKILFPTKVNKNIRKLYPTSVYYNLR
jgi:hypothetical protein